MKSPIGADFIREEYKHKRLNYLMVNVIAKRARSLVDGEKPLVDPHGAFRPSEIAVKELKAAKLSVSPKTKKNKLVDIVRVVSESS